MRGEVSWGKTGPFRVRLGAENRVERCQQKQAKRSRSTTTKVTSRTSLLMMFVMMMAAAGMLVWLIFFFFFGFCISGWRQGRILPGEDDHAADAARSERAAAGKGRDEH